LKLGKGRLEAFSDGVIAILITIMVLELKVPHGASLEALAESWPVFLSYVLSFVFLGIYWNNHHHLLHTIKKVSGSILWANLHLLFWLSLVPFTTGWMGENEFAQWPVFVYSLNLALSGFAYFILSRRIIAVHGADSELARAVGKDGKGLISLAAYIIAMVISFWSSHISIVIAAIPAVMWLIPDRRIEKTLTEH
jgi:uncharacterized membrane protein